MWNVSSSVGVVAAIETEAMGAERIIIKYVFNRCTDWHLDELKSNQKILEMKALAVSSDVLFVSGSEGIRRNSRALLNQWKYDGTWIGSSGLNQPIVIETWAIDVERISNSISNSISISISTINSQNIYIWTYTVGLLAAVVVIESVKKRKICKPENVLLSCICNCYYVNRTLRRRNETIVYRNYP